MIDPCQVSQADSPTNHHHQHNQQVAENIFRNLTQMSPTSNHGSDSGGISHRLPFQDPISYRKRLQTFTPGLYFSKPLLISPLVCARFGWACVRKDILQCVECQSAIAILFHSDLSPESYTDLAWAYRKMLATQHKVACPFAMDAQRWLILYGEKSNDSCMDDQDDNNDNTSNNHNDQGVEPPRQRQPQPQQTKDSDSWVVPPYLISMSKVFQVLDDCTENGFVTREYLREEALALAESCYQQRDISRIRVPIPVDLMARIKVLCGLYDSKGTVVSDDVLFSFLKNLLLVDMMSSGDILLLDKEHHPCQQQKELPNLHRDKQEDLSLDFILLALFGWSVGNNVHQARGDNDDDDDNNNGGDESNAVSSDQSPRDKTCHRGSKKSSSSSLSLLFTVSCPLCLCKCPIPYSSCSSDSPPNNQLDHDISSVACTTEEREEYSTAKKRYRVETGGFVVPPSVVANTDPDSVPIFHLVDSHRHFCPMSSGFVHEQEHGRNKEDIFTMHTRSTTRPGWEVFLSSLCRCRGENTHTGRIKESNGVELLGKIRKALHNSRLASLTTRDDSTIMGRQ